MVPHAVSATLMMEINENICRAGIVSHPVPLVPQALDLSLQIGFHISVDPPVFAGIRDPYLFIDLIILT